MTLSSSLTTLFVLIMGVAIVGGLAGRSGTLRAATLRIRRRGRGRGARWGSVGETREASNDFL